MRLVNYAGGSRLEIQALKQRAISMRYDYGLSVPQIMRQTNITRPTLYRYLSHNTHKGLSHNNHHPRLLEGDYGSLKEMAERLGINYNSLHNYQYVASQYKLDIRMSTLSFNHHQIAAPLEDRLEIPEQRKLGEMLGNTVTPGNPQLSHDVIIAPRLPEMGISLMQSHRWQKLVEQEAGRLATQGKPIKGNNVVTLKDYGLTKKESSRAQELVEEAAELYIAREKLSSPYHRDDGTNVPSWSQYCESIGLEKRTANRWLASIFGNVRLPSPPLPKAELYIAREKLSYSPSEAALTMHGTIVPRITWKSYCESIGLEKRTANRWPTIHNNYYKQSD